MHWHWHCIDCIVIVIGILLGKGPYSWSRVATFGRRGQLAPQLGVFFREAPQLRGRILGAVGLRIQYSVLRCKGFPFKTYACFGGPSAPGQWWR